MISKVLPDFQEFLTSRALVDKRHAPFYARWVSKFLAFPDKDENLGFAERKEKFLEDLSKIAGVVDWQKEQAKTALQLYFEQYKSGCKDDDIYDSAGYKSLYGLLFYGLIKAADR